MLVLVCEVNVTLLATWSDTTDYAIEALLAGHFVHWSEVILQLILFRYDPLLGCFRSNGRLHWAPVTLRRCRRRRIELIWRFISLSLILKLHRHQGLVL